MYELAIQLGKRSTELTEVAEQLGMGHLIAASPLTAEQQAQLLTHFTGIAPPPPPGAPSLGAPVGGMAPAPSMAGPGGRGLPKVVLAVGAVVVGALLFGGAYTMVSGERDELTRHVDAEAAADARGEIPESETTQPAPAAPGGSDQVGAPVTTDPITATTADLEPHQRLCMAGQKVADLEASMDVLNTDAPTWEQLVWATDQMAAIAPELAKAYDELRPVLPPEMQGGMDQVRAAELDILNRFAAVTTPEELIATGNALDEVNDRLQSQLSQLDDYVDGNCGVNMYS